MAALLTRLSLQPVLHQPCFSRCVSASHALLRFKRPTLDQPLPPKRPPNAFAIFVQDAIKGVDEPQPLTRCGSLWRELDTDKKKEYQDLFEQRKKIYEKSLEQFYSGLDVSKEEYLQGLKEYKLKMMKFRQKQGKQRLGLLKPRKLTPMNMFMRHALTGISMEELKVTFADAAHEWKSLPDSEKELYKQEAETANQKLMVEYEHRKANLQKIMVLPEFKPAEKKKELKKKVQKEKKVAKVAKSAKKAVAKAKGAGKQKKQVVDERDHDFYTADDLD